MTPLGDVDHLVSFIRLMYAMVVILAFSDLARAGANADPTHGGWKRLAVLPLFFASLVFVVADYEVYFTLASSHAPFYKGSIGVSLFLIDVTLLSVHYFLLNIASERPTLRRLESYIALLLSWQFLVIAWYILQRSDFSKYAAHLVRLGILIGMWIALRLAVSVVPVLRSAYRTSLVTSVAGVDRAANLATIAIALLLSALVTMINVSRMARFIPR